MHKVKRCLHSRKIYFALLYFAQTSKGERHLTEEKPLPEMQFERVWTAAAAATTFIIKEKLPRLFCAWLRHRIIVFVFLSSHRCFPSPSLPFSISFVLRPYHLAAFPRRNDYYGNCTRHSNYAGRKGKGKEGKVVAVVYIQFVSRNYNLSRIGRENRERASELSLFSLERRNSLSIIAATCCYYCQDSTIKISLSLSLCRNGFYLCACVLAIIMM